MFNKVLFDNSRSDGFPVMEVATTRPEAPRQFVPLRRTELQGQVIGPLADLRLLQYFGFRRAECDKTLEALYRFPLPGDAAVTGVTVRFGDVEIVAELKEREQAEADYEEAKRAGHQAALATRESPDVFTLRVAGLQPDQEIRVETAYVQLARMEANDWTLRLPLTTSPRYVRADEANSRHAAGQPLALLRDPGHRFSLDLRFPDAGKVSSPTHTLAAEAEDGGLRVRLKDGEVMPDRDCVLNWRVAQESQHPALHLHVYDDRQENSVYFLALVASPAEKPNARIPRESILLVDHSGSMGGPKWEAADWAVKQFLNGLAPQDSMALGLFHNSVKWFADRPRKTDSDTVSAAIDFLQRNRDSGGTELGVALEQALGQKRTGGEMSRHVLILTDAEVSDSGRILRLAEGESERADRRRISVLCIDAAPNSFLARELAERGGGTATFLTSQPDQEDISTALDRILEDWSAPVLTGLRLEVNRTGVQAVGRAVQGALQNRGSAIDIGDLPAGRAVWVAGRVPRGESADLSFRLLTADGREVAARRCDLNAKPAGAAVKALFGASRVLALEFLTTAYYDDDQIKSQLDRLGYDPASLTRKSDTHSLYPENVQQNARDGLKGLLVREALRYGLACGETAFIAVRKVAGKLIEETSVVANALPLGWSEEFLSGGATRSIDYCMSMSAPMPAMAAPMMPSPASPPTGMMRFNFSTPGQADAADAVPPQTKSSGTRGLSLGELPADVAAAAGGVFGAVAGLFKKAQPARSSAPVPAQSDSQDVPTFLQRRAEPGRPGWTLFEGLPVFVGEEAVLFDTSRQEDKDKIAHATKFSRLIVQFAAGTPDPATIDSGLTILIYVDDLASPRARVRLVDLVKQGGVRPLNLQRGAGQTVRIVLEDPNGAWQAGAPELAVALA